MFYFEMHNWINGKKNNS